MKIIIDIPDEVKEAFDNANIADVDCYVNDYDLLLGKAIKNCVPLPKGHGRLIDADELNKCIVDRIIFPYVPINKIQDADTIIEADKC